VNNLKFFLRAYLGALFILAAVIIGEAALRALGW